MNALPLSSVLFLALLPGQAPDQALKVISGATLIDPARPAPVKDAVIVIEGARIRSTGARSNVKVPDGAQRIDAAGKFVIPGLADMHTHLWTGAFGGPSQDQRQNLQRFLAWGITLVFDPGIEMKPFADFKRLSGPDEAAYPHLFATGRPMSARKGWGTFGGSGFDTIEEGRAGVRELKAANVDAIKVVYDDMSWLTKRPLPALKREVMAAIIDEAHKQGLKVHVHAPTLKWAKEALAAGADGLAHGILSDPVDDEFIRLMKQNGAVYVSTNTAFEAIADLSGWARRQSLLCPRGAIPTDVFETLMSPKTLNQWQSGWSMTPFTREHLPVLKANVKRVFDAGIPVVIGTDSGVPGVLLGLSAHVEMALHVEAGLKPEEVLRAATVNAARMVGRESDLGSVATGKLADLLILDADPLADIRNTLKIHRVIKGGVVYDPAELRRSGK